MSRAEREQLIERYLQGKMTSSEEQNFFIEVASSNELRHELKAYQVVERALGKDRVANTSSYTSLRSQLQGQLAASHHAATTSSASQATGSTTASSMAGSVAGMVPLKWFITAVVAASVTAGALVVKPLLDRATDEVKAPVSSQQIDSSRGVNTPSLLDTTVINETSARTEATDNAPAPSTGEAVQKPGASTADRTQPRKKMTAIEQLQPQWNANDSSGIVKQAADQQNALKHTDSTAKQTQTTDSGSVNIQLKIGMPKPK